MALSDKIGKVTVDTEDSRYKYVNIENNKHLFLKKSRKDQRNLKRKEHLKTNVL